jgi:cytochrome c biogenesis protein
VVTGRRGTLSTVSRLDSSLPPEPNPDVRRPLRRSGPSGPLGFVWQSTVMGWRWLTRMRTALYLLAVLGLLTLVATVIPQQPNVPSTVEEWLAGDSGPGTTIAEVLRVTGAFDVYGSLLFNLLLFALFLSLTACLVPRIRAWVRLVRRSRPPLVRRPGRTDLVAELETSHAPDHVHAVAAELLRSRHWRVRATSGDDAADEAAAAPGAKPAQVAAEKGLWSREGGSLLFHLSFYVLLAAIVFGQLLTFEGQRGLVEGEAGFTDAQVSYWTYRPGRWWGPDDHAGWRMDLEEFHVDWVRDPLAPGAGQPTTFRSDVTVTPPDGEPFAATVEGNKPLVVDGMKIHQLDWGYSPRVVVEVDGEVVHDRFLTSQVADGGVYRAAVKAPSADPDVGLEVFLYPFAPDNEDGIPVPTGAPWDEAPLLIFRQWRGDLQLGRTQQTVNELDTSELESEGGAFLRPGDSVTVGDVTVSFPELRRWVGFQVSSRPQIPWLLAGSALLIGGLVTALYAYRRRLWVLAVRSEASGRTLVTVAGRAFQRPDTFEVEHQRLVAALADAIDATPTDPDDDPAHPIAPAPAGAGVRG